MTGTQTMEMMMTPFTESLEGLAETPTLRAMQIALAAIDRHVSTHADPDEGMAEAYDALQSAIAGLESDR